MRKIKILMLLFIFPAAGFTQKTVTAASIIASINNNAPVNITDAQVTGDLDFTRLANMKAESSSNSSEKVYISTVNSPVSFTNCSFKGKCLVILTLTSASLSPIQIAFLMPISPLM